MHEIFQSFSIPPLLPGKKEMVINDKPNETRNPDDKIIEWISRLLVWKTMNIPWQMFDEKRSSSLQFPHRLMRDFNAKRNARITVWLQSRVSFPRDVE